MLTGKAKADYQKAYMRQLRRWQRIRGVLAEEGFALVVQHGDSPIVVDKLDGTLPPGYWWRKPNVGEQRLLSLMKEMELPFVYTGNGAVWFGNRNPDFLNTNGHKQVIEFMGTRRHLLWDGANRIEHYKQYGLECLVVWSEELREPERLKGKLLEFVLSGL